MTKKTFFAPLERSRWFRDYDGVNTTTKDYDDIEQHSFDFADELESGETISSVAWSADGITVNSSSLSGSVETIEMTGSGSAEATLTLSTGRSLVKKFRWRDIGSASSDYE